MYNGNEQWKCAMEKVDKGNKDSEEVEQEEDNVNDNNKVKEEEKQEDNINKEEEDFKEVEEDNDNDIDKYFSGRSIKFLLKNFTFLNLLQLKCAMEMCNEQ